MQKIYKDFNTGEFVMELRVPLRVSRTDLFGEEGKDFMDNILGVICGDEIGFAHWIDMSYKGKGDQISTIFYIYRGEKDEFRKVCSDMRLHLHEYAVCIKCLKPIMDIHGWDGGPAHLECIPRI